ncbi:hypothetical protein COCON_G00227000 [Conger conger]|uniref:Uncharacterized protein n=1 Tax=Conger conger TaxID=82655 RepID=A0A9Q1CX65_CONCO|nr:hypothetical protein COCON_G00227000 [Conger conger]
MCVNPELKAPACVRSAGSGPGPGAGPGSSRWGRWPVSGPPSEGRCGGPAADAA